MHKTNKIYRRIFTDLLLVVVGVSIIFISSLLQHIKIPKEQEYLFSSFLNYNFTKPVGVVFFITALLIGCLFKLNPWEVALCLFVVFPITSIVEGAFYPDSHNLIPFEFAMYFIYALPSIIAVYIGKFISKQLAKRKLSAV